MLETAETKPEIKEAQRYLGQLRIPKREEFLVLKNLCNKSQLQNTTQRLFCWNRDHVSKAITHKFFKFAPTVDMHNRLEWEVMYNIFLRVGEGKGWIKDNEPTPFDWEQDLLDRV